MAYKTIAVKDSNYKKLLAVKLNFESDVRHVVTWDEFLLILATGYIMGRQIMSNESRLQIEIEDS